MYQFTNDDDTSMQDHANTSNFVCQMLNADEKLSGEEQTLLLASLNSQKLYNNIAIFAQLGGRITLEQTLVALKENNWFVVKVWGAGWTYVPL